MSDSKFEFDHFLQVVASGPIEAQQTIGRADSPFDLGPADPKRYKDGSRVWGFGLTVWLLTDKMLEVFFDRVTMSPAYLEPITPEGHDPVRYRSAVIEQCNLALGNASKNARDARAWVAHVMNRLEAYKVNHRRDLAGRIAHLESVIAKTPDPETNAGIAVLRAELEALS